MSISAPRYASAPTERLGRTDRALAIVGQQFLNQSTGATWAVVALTYIAVILTDALYVLLASFVGQATSATFEFAYESPVLPFLLLIVATVVGAGCIAQDLGSRSIVLFLSRPIKTLDYLGAKMAATGSWILIATVGPGIVVVVIEAALGTVSASVALSAAFGFLATGLLATIFFTGLVVALSSLTTRPLYAGVATFGLVLSLYIGVGVVAGITGNSIVRYADPITNVRSVAQAAFGVSGAHPTDPVASAIILLVGGACLAALAAWRLSRVEVVAE